MINLITIAHSTKLLTFLQQFYFLKWNRHGIGERNFLFSDSYCFEDSFQIVILRMPSDYCQIYIYLCNNCIYGHICKCQTYYGLDNFGTKLYGLLLFQSSSRIIWQNTSFCHSHVHSCMFVCIVLFSKVLFIQPTAPKRYFHMVCCTAAALC